MPLIKGGRFVEDPFVNLPDDAPFPSSPVIVPLARFRAERAELLARRKPIGVRLKSAESPELIQDDLRDIAVVALEFPAFRDGRGFSWARMLRQRFGYTGEIRAVGNFLYDQLAFMARVGIDSFEVRQDFREEDFTRAMGEMRYVYQPSADHRKTIGALGDKG
jgi:uncharacterized protein (DUF934 family)